MHEQAIAEGGATGPTFRPEGMDCGFAVIAVAGRKKSKNEDVVILFFSCKSLKVSYMYLIVDSTSPVSDVEEIVVKNELKKFAICP